MKLIYYVSTTFLFLLFAYSVVQYIRKSNKDKNECKCQYKNVQF